MRARIVLMVCFMCVKTAHAQESDAARATRLFEEATQNALNGDYANACPKFEESLRLTPGLGTEFNLAICNAQTGKRIVAARMFRSIERRAREAGKSERARAAAAESAKLDAHVSYVKLTNKNPSQASVVIRIDGEVVPESEYDAWIVAPGAHNIEARDWGAGFWRSAFQTTSGGPTSIEIPVLSAGDTVPKEHSVERAPYRTDRVAPRASNPRTAGYVVAGVGIVGLMAGAVTGVLILGAKSTVDEMCTDQGCPPGEGRDARDRGHTLLPINAIAFGVGLVGLGVGAYLLVTAKPPSTSAFYNITQGRF